MLDVDVSGPRGGNRRARARARTAAQPTGRAGSAAARPTRSGSPRQKVTPPAAARDARPGARGRAAALGGLTERLLQASASSYVVSPRARRRGQRPRANSDRLSAGYLVARGAECWRGWVNWRGAPKRPASACPRSRIDAEKSACAAGRARSVHQRARAAVTAIAARLPRSSRATAAPTLDGGGAPRRAARTIQSRRK